MWSWWFWRLWLWLRRSLLVPTRLVAPRPPLSPGTIKLCQVSGVSEDDEMIGRGAAWPAVVRETARETERKRQLQRGGATAQRNAKPDGIHAGSRERV